MKDTLKTFRDANEKYQTAKNTFVNLKNFYTQSKDKVEKMLEKDSDEYRNWVIVVTEAEMNATDEFTAMAEARFKEIQSHDDEKNEAAIKFFFDQIEAKIE